MSGFSSIAQNKTKEQLERERADILKRIQETEKILGQTTSEKQVNLGQLTAINSQIESQQGLIRTLNSELGLINKEIQDNTREVTRLQRDLDDLKDEYARMIYTTSKNASGLNHLMFLFSSKSFYQFWRRYKYMEQYADVRRSQAAQIEETKERLSLQLMALQSKKDEQRKLLNEQMARNTQLQELQKKQQGIVNTLSRKERDLRSDLAARKRAADQLNKLIADLVRKEMAKTSEAPARTSEATGRTRNLDAEAIRLSANFSENKNRLPWPVASGFVSQRFGNQPHPTLKGITIPNDGIDIQTNRNEPVRAIFDGEVTSIATVPGMNTVVLIKHGEFFTVYARLAKVNVKNGQKVKAMDTIGEAYTSKDGVTEVQFQLWKSTEALNPQDWLIKR